MKKILAIAALTAASISSAHATVTPASSSDINTNAVVNTYTFQYSAQAPTVAPQFVTAVRSLDPSTLNPVLSWLIPLLRQT